MHTDGSLTVGFDWGYVYRRIKSRGQEGTSPGLGSIIVSSLGWEQLREELVHPTVVLDVFYHGTAICNHSHASEHASGRVADRLEASTDVQIGDLEH